MMMTPMPAMKPATMGSDRKSASQPSLSSPINMTISPATTAVAATSSMYCADEAGARRSNATANSGAMVESAPTETIGLEPMTKKTNDAVMNAIIAVKAGTPASCDVASCSGIAIANNVMPASIWPEKLARVRPRKIWLSPLATRR